MYWYVLICILMVMALTYIYLDDGLRLAGSVNGK
jgi:hypothetical protein